ncbi:exported protein of unknown function [Candidatus Promineifilum breve]|uniref:Uncharacterized protein n=1 Tax=Candidatus Promineifilum breve TaxID=1806508 RepID=A0A160T758_9CHLR|nr:right-handed parallel beta-helix repeat-containing protein [Candidatus Promineifilum breve]CUS05792.1 exported protein of unknown function [Candidatus Promineifilum breve]
MHTKRIVRWSIVLLLLLALPVVAAVLAQGPEQPQVPGCDLIVAHTGNYNYYSINDALNALKAIPQDLPYGYTICLRAGVYNEKVWIQDDNQDQYYQLRGLRLVAEPGSDDDVPTIDGTGIYFRSWYDGLIMIRESGITLEGLEVRNSHGRGIFIYGEDAHLAYNGDEPHPDPDEMQGDAIYDVLLSNLSVHHNWTDGIVANGQDQPEVGLNGYVFEPKVVHRYYPTNIVVRDSVIYDNAQKARAMPVVFEGRRIAGVQDASAWEFINAQLDPWNNPFWQGKYVRDPHGVAAVNGDMSFFPDEDLDAISVMLNGADGLDRMLISAPASQNGSRKIPAAHVTGNGGAELVYDGDDILEYNPATGLWSFYFNGDFLKTESSCSSLTVDGFEVIATGQLLLSFNGCASFTMTSMGATTLYPSDLFLFNGTLGANTSGTFSRYLDRDYTKWSLGTEDNLLDFAFDPSGALVGRIKRKGSDDKEDKELFWFDESGKVWLPYMHMELKYPAVEGQPLTYQFNPMGNGIMAVSIRGTGGNPRLFIGGKVEGTVGLGFTATGSSSAIHNHVYQNYGEGLSSFFNARNVTVRDNVVYDNIHANLYVNDVQSAVVDSNIAYCSNDRRFWQMGENPLGRENGYQPSRGLAIQDETPAKKQEDKLDAASKTQPSSHITIANNIAAGCMNNFYFSKNSGSPGKDAPANDIRVFHNTLVEARGDVVDAYSNVLFTNKINPDADYFVNSLFANNLIAQWPSGKPDHIISTWDKKNDLSFPPPGLEMRNNLYQFAPPANFLSEPGQVIADPLLFNAGGALVAGLVNPDWYNIQPNSPARNSGFLSTVVWTPFDFYGIARQDGQPDIGAYERPAPNDNPSMSLGETVTGTAWSETEPTGTFQVGIEEFRLLRPTLVLIDVLVTGGSPEPPIDEVRLSHDCTWYANDTIASIGSIDINKRGYILYDLPAGDYCISIWPQIWSAESTNADYTLSLSSPLLLSAAAAGLAAGGDVGGIHFYSEDILAYSKMKNGPDQWRMIFDGSDVGITPNVSNIAVDRGNRILLTLRAQQNLPTIGVVGPHDILAFDPERLGPDTAGTLSLVFEGVDQEFTTVGERLDGIDGRVDVGQQEYDLIVSTEGVARGDPWSGPMKHDNEDVFGLIEDWGGSFDWYRFFDVKGIRNAQPAELTAAVSVPGLRERNVFGLAYDDSDGVMYLTIRGSAYIHQHHHVTQTDVFAINYPSYTWGGVIWRGTEHGWNYKIDAIELNGW